MLDTSGKWWKGTSFEDLKQYLINLTAGSYPANEVRQSICVCRNKVFHIEADPDEVFSQRICAKCKTKAFIADSEEYVKDAHPKRLKCVACKKDEFIVGVTFSFREDKSLLSLLKKKEIKWITEGEMCSNCGVCGSHVEWKIDYAPSRHLLDKV
jgi:hypothetical protein